jgi:hypothetical protein
VKLTIHFLLVLRLRKPGAISPLPHTASWDAQELFLILVEDSKDKPDNSLTWLNFPQKTFSSLFTLFNREGHFHIVISPNSDTTKFVSTGERDSCNGIVNYNDDVSTSAAKKHRSFFE